MRGSTDINVWINKSDIELNIAQILKRDGEMRKRAQSLPPESYKLWV